MIKGSVTLHELRQEAYRKKIGQNIKSKQRGSKDENIVGRG